MIPLEYKTQKLREALVHLLDDRKRTSFAKSDPIATEGLKRSFHVLRPRIEGMSGVIAEGILAPMRVLYERTRKRSGVGSESLTNLVRLIEDVIRIVASTLLIEEPRFVYEAYKVVQRSQNRYFYMIILAVLRRETSVGWIDAGDVEGQKNPSVDFMGIVVKQCATMFYWDTVDTEDHLYFFVSVLDALGCAAPAAGFIYNSGTVENHPFYTSKVRFGQAPHIIVAINQMIRKDKYIFGDFIESALEGGPYRYGRNIHYQTIKSVLGRALLVYEPATFQIFKSVISWAYRPKTYYGVRGRKLDYQQLAARSVAKDVTKFGKWNGTAFSQHGRVYEPGTFDNFDEFIGLLVSRGVRWNHFEPWFFLNRDVRRPRPPFNGYALPVIATVIACSQLDQSAAMVTKDVSWMLRRYLHEDNPGSYFNGNLTRVHIHAMIYSFIRKDFRDDVDMVRKCGDMLLVTNDGEEYANTPGAVYNPRIPTLMTAECATLLGCLPKSLWYKIIKFWPTLYDKFVEDRWGTTVKARMEMRINRIEEMKFFADYHVQTIMVGLDEGTPGGKRGNTRRRRKTPKTSPVSGPPNRLTRLHNDQLEMIYSYLPNPQTEEVWKKTMTKIPPIVKTCFRSKQDASRRTLHLHSRGTRARRQAVEAEEYAVNLENEIMLSITKKFYLGCTRYQFLCDMLCGHYKKGLAKVIKDIEIRAKARKARVEAADMAREDA
jgi:hypothetical protein